LKEKIIEGLKALPKTFAATLLISSGVVLFINCELGADPITVFYDGLLRAFGIPVSVSDQVLMLILLILAFILNREAVGVNTVVFTLLIGICIEIPTRILEPFMIPQRGIFVRAALMLTAQLLLCTGYAWMQTFDSGISSEDAVLYTLVKKWNTRYMVIRVLSDVIYIVTGFLLGGVVGVGSLFAVFTTGFLIEKIKSFIENGKKRGVKQYG